MKIPLNRPLPDGSSNTLRTPSAAARFQATAITRNDVPPFWKNGKKPTPRPVDAFVHTRMELAFLLADFKKDQEVICPSFTFPSTANAFVLRGLKHALY